jgi:integrase
MKKADAIRNLRQKGKSWYYDHGVGGNRWAPLGNDEAKARAAAVKLNAARAASPGTVDAMLRDHLAALTGNIGDNTLKIYRIYRVHLSAVFGALRPEEITQADVMRYLKKCPRKSFRTEVSLLSGAYANWMCPDDDSPPRLTFNPCLGVKSDRPRPRRDRLLADYELDAIVAKAPECVALAIEIAYSTGLRISDLCRLTWTNAGDVFITGKTGQKMRYESTPEFEAHLAKAREIQGDRRGLYVLCRPDGMPWTVKTLRYVFNKAAAAAQVKDAHFHDLRAKVATDINEAYGIEAAQKHLGHKSARTTEVYLRDKSANVVRPHVRRTAGGRKSA